MVTKEAFLASPVYLLWLMLQNLTKADLKNLDVSILSPNKAVYSLRALRVSRSEGLWAFRGE